ncbi:MAG: Hpt domain-containing protein [Chlamydiae bacterium]|nr:Hpt domain-containing protein [Chlamydiota bacterium]
MNAPANNNIRKIQNDYKLTIPQKIEDLGKLFNAAKKDPNAENLSALRFFVHKLAGNSGTYGYPEVSVVCKEFELEIVEILKSPSSLQWKSQWDGNLDKVKKGFYPTEKT